MPIHELITCCTPYHPQQTSATPHRAPELISVQCIGIKIWKSRVKALRNAFLNSDVHTLGSQMHLGLKNIVIVHFSMRRKNQTMVDKIPWDTCVIALIFCVFKTEFYKSTVFRLKLRCFPLPPFPPYNVETLEK